ncbi:hypothetical protein CEXT_230491 [Caerostris extrusa]|uniref:Uncharacterized protein n=1 Tax=Caerostris extrusa TaxID=172846 RepID=A0AAV4U9T9_CAEEX|nr:hypothetical protein CEXT_230491 [Caerostris extrusa]
MDFWLKTGQLKGNVNNTAKATTINVKKVWRANPKTAKTSTGFEVDGYSDTISLSQKSGATKTVSMTTGCPKYLSQIIF